jgi:uncharacterized protein (DUF2141 family)
VLSTTDERCPDRRHWRSANGGRAPFTNSDRRLARRRLKRQPAPFTQASTTRRSAAASSLKKEIAMTALNTLIITALAAAVAPAAHAQQATGDLTLAFPALATHQGQVMIVVYDSPDAWKSGKPVRATMASAADVAPSAKITGLPPGTYAAKVFQDVDGDGKMGLNPFGLPTEPYGFSNGALPNMGPPSFEAAAFEVKAGANAQSIQLK